MIDIPMMFNDAIGFLMGKTQDSDGWNSAEWTAMESDVRVRSFWSANVENARFLDRAQTALFDFTAKVTDVTTDSDGNPTTRLRVSGRSDFVTMMRDFMVSEGMAKREDFPTVNHKDVRDIRSNARLNLIFQVQTQQAYSYGQWKQGMTPAALSAYPAAELIRVWNVNFPRPRHQENLGVIRLKTDPWWAEYLNNADIGGFGVPWGPYGFNSGVNQRDVSAKKAKVLGLIAPSAHVETPEMNEGLKVGIKSLSPEVSSKLKDELRALMAKSGRKAIKDDGESLTIGGK